MRTSTTRLIAENIIGEKMLSLLQDHPVMSDGNLEELNTVHEMQCRLRCCRGDEQILTMLEDYVGVGDITETWRKK